MGGREGDVVGEGKARRVRSGIHPKSGWCGFCGAVWSSWRKEVHLARALPLPINASL